MFPTHGFEHGPCDFFMSQRFANGWLDSIVATLREGARQRITRLTIANAHFFLRRKGDGAQFQSTPAQDRQCVFGDGTPDGASRQIATA